MDYVGRWVGGLAGWPAGLRWASNQKLIDICSRIDFLRNCIEFTSVFESDPLEACDEVTIYFGFYSPRL